MTYENERNLSSCDVTMLSISRQLGARPKKLRICM